MSTESAVAGALLGTAVGDALGLPYEGLSPERARRLLGEPTSYRLLFGRGMVSDDTEHACLVLQALTDSGGEPRAFERDLARRLRWWLLSLPAGVGWATLRATTRLWMGVTPARSGVRSAGNGPAMRAAVLGAAAPDVTSLRALVRVSSRITHSDPRAEHGALAVALAAHLGRSGAAGGGALLEALRPLAPEADARLLLERLEGASDSAARGEETPRFAARLGLARGVSGFVDDTVPVAVHAWLSHPDDLEGCIRAAVSCGGDADSVAAIAGGIAGATLGAEGLPARLLGGLLEWPRTVPWMRSLAARAAEAMEAGTPQAAPGLPVPGLLARNSFFASVVIAHGLRRLLPPYTRG